MRSGFAGFLSGTAVSALALAGVSVMGAMTEDRGTPGEASADILSAEAIEADLMAQASVVTEPDVLAVAPEAAAPEPDLSPNRDTVAGNSLSELPKPIADLDSPDPEAPAASAKNATVANKKPDVAQSEIAMATPDIDESPQNLTNSAEDVQTSGRVSDSFGEGVGEPARLAPDATPRVTAAPLPITRSLVETGQDTAEQDEVGSQNQPLQSLSPETDADTSNIADADAPVDTTAGTIGDLAQDVTTNRLPAIGTTASVEASTLGIGTNGTSENLPAIERFAVSFEHAGDKPLVSIILVDNGTPGLGPEALADFPHPVSVAIDVTRPDAAQTASLYRESGYEVLAKTNLPAQANAQDTEVAMATYLQAIPEAVAIFEGSDSGLQSNREIPEQLGDILQDTGHGVVLRPNGLNSAQKRIAGKGVPSLSFFKDIDGANEDTRAIRRTLDQAVFRAGQIDDSIIVVGRLKPDTISALVLWSLQDRATGVALAPVSVALRGPQAGVVAEREDG